MSSNTRNLSGGQASKVLIVPGLRDSGAGHWQTRWQERLSARRVVQEDWSQPDLARWAGEVERALEAAGEGVHDTWIVAHSFGCLATLKALADSGAPVAGVFLAAPADPDKFGLGSALRLRSPVTGLVVGSTTDPWLSWERARQWAARWDLPLLSAGAAGHINVDSGHGEWSEGWEWFQQFRRIGADYSYQQTSYQQTSYHQSFDVRRAG